MTRGYFIGMKPKWFGRTWVCLGDSLTESNSVFDENGKVVYPTSTVFQPYTVRVSISDLHIRKGPGTNYGSRGFTGKGVFTIVSEATGKGASKWGLLKSYASKRNGWISLDYVKKV